MLINPLRTSYLRLRLLVIIPVLDIYLKIDVPKSECAVTSVDPIKCLWLCLKCPALELNLGILFRLGKPVTLSCEPNIIFSRSVRIVEADS